MTAGILRWRTEERTTGSIRVLCVHTKRTPALEAEAGGGGVPLTTTPPPKRGATWGMAHIGSINPTEMRMAANTIPSGIHRRIRRAADGVGRFTRRPSWKITGSGPVMWRPCIGSLLSNGG